MGDKFIFTTINDKNSSTNFWSSDGTEAGTSLLFEVESSYGNEYITSTMITRNNELFLHLPGEGVGDNLWVTDGTSAGTKKLSEEYENFKFQNMLLLGNNIILQSQSNKSFHLSDLWALTENNSLSKLGTYFLKNKDLAYDNGYIKTEKLLYFTTYRIENNNIIELWATDGTENGIANVATFDSEHDLDLTIPIRNFTLNDFLYFVTYDQEYNISGLWVSDGTTEGTFDLKEIGINTDNTYEVEFIGSVNDRLIMSLTDQNLYKKIWSTDGFANGTYKLSDINTVRFNPWNRNEINGFLYYINDQANNLSVWKTDGTIGGAVEVIKVPKNQHSETYYSSMYQYISGNKIYLASHFEKNYDLYSLNVDTEELELIRSSQDGGVDDMVFHDRVTYMLYSGSDKNKMHYNFVGNTEEIDINDKTNSEPYNDLELQLSADYIYFYADYEGDESYQLYRFKNPASGISSIEDFESNQVNFYPNPANNNLTLELDEMTDISIVDINGNQVLSFSDFTGGVIDVSKLAVGFYSITNNNGKLLGKFIKAE